MRESFLYCIKIKLGRELFSACVTAGSLQLWPPDPVIRVGTSSPWNDGGADEPPPHSSEEFEQPSSGL